MTVSGCLCFPTVMVMFVFIMFVFVKAAWRSREDAGRCYLRSTSAGEP